MDNNENIQSYEDVLKDLKNRVEILRIKCSTEQLKLEKKVSEMSRLEKDIGQTEYELTEYKSKTNEINELWKEREIEIEKLKFMQEKASVIIECNRMKNKLGAKTMDIIKRNYSNLAASAFKNVIQETGKMIINNEINNLTDRKKELDNKLRRFQATKTENENHLAEARAELMEIRARGETIVRLRKKLEESDASRLNAIAKLKNLRTLRFAGCLKAR